MDHGYHGNAVFCSDSGTEIDNVLIIFTVLSLSNSVLANVSVTVKAVFNLTSFYRFDLCILSFTRLFVSAFYRFIGHFGDDT